MISTRDSVVSEVREPKSSLLGTFGSAEATIGSARAQQQNPLHRLYPCKVGALMPDCLVNREQHRTTLPEHVRAFLNFYRRVRSLVVAITANCNHVSGVGSLISLTILTFDCQHIEHMHAQPCRWPERSPVKSNSTGASSTREGNM